MITVEEALKQGIEIIGAEKTQPNFVVSSKAYIKVAHNSKHSIEIQDTFNKNLAIEKYSNKNIKQLIITYLVYPEIWDGVERKEKSFFKRKERKFFIDIRFPDYQRFCDATKQEAMKIMAEQTLRGTEKFLSKVKDFDYHKFYADLKELFEKEGIL